MMKKVYLFLVLIISCWGCQDMKVGYLKAENAGYLPNELEVRKTLDPEEDAEIFKKEITVRGGGVMELPLYTELPEGRYVVTLKVSNDGYSELLSDVYTFVVK